MTQSIQCLTCKHYRGLWECEAFPDGIPEVISSGDHDHREPFKGDNGIRWEAADQQAQELRERYDNDDELLD